MVDPDQVVVQDVRRDSVIQLQYTHRPGAIDDLLILDGADDHVVDRFKLEEVVDFAVVRVVFGQKVTNKGLLSKSKHLVAR